MPQLSSISVTEDQAKRIKATCEHEHYGLSTFFQIVLNYYFNDKGISLIKRDGMLFVGYPLIIAVLFLISFYLSGVTAIFWFGLLTIGLSFASMFYFFDKYWSVLKGEK